MTTNPPVPFDFCVADPEKVKWLVGAFIQEKALLVGAFSVITNLRMELFEALPGPRRAGAAAGHHRVRAAGTWWRGGGLLGTGAVQFLN